MVYYRKYRPQTIEQLDLSSVRERLTAILTKGDVPHAFLFSGPKGLGKTSSARILAKAINCQSKKKGSIEPCNDCESCSSITNGSNIDVIEIDAASNRGIDEIRELREKIKFAPANLKKKVYIIDEVHMLTTEAFNALLKTLEEPPSHVLFVLCTTEIWKVPPTILSRTFHVPFEKPSPEEAARSLSRIVEGEKLKLEDGVVARIITLADGAFRDGAKILEELALAAHGEKITLATVEKSYKTDSIDGEVENILSSLATRDTKSAIASIDRLASGGCDFKIVNEKFVDRLHRLLLKRFGLPTEAKDISEFDISSIEKLITLGNEAYKQLKTSVLPQLPLELLVVKWSLNEDKISKIKYQISDEKFEKTFESGFASSFETEIKPKTILATPVSTSQTSNGAVEGAFLEKLIAEVKKENVSIAGILRSCKLGQMTDKEVEIVAPFKFHGDKLRESKNHSLIETVATTIIGKKIAINIQTKQ